MKNLFLELRDYFKHIIFKILYWLFLPLIIFISILVNLFNSISPIETIKNWFNDNNEKETNDDIRSGCFGSPIKIHPFMIPVNILKKEKDERLNIIKEYENNEELKKREFYNIIYASKILGTTICYFGYSRRIKINTKENFISKKYIVTLSNVIRHLFVIFYEKNITEKSLLNFLKATYQYTSNNKIKKFKITQCIFDNLSYYVTEENLLLSEKIYEIIINNNKQIKNNNYHLNTVFDYLFRNKDEIDDDTSREFFMKFLNKHSNNSVLFLENKLNEVIQIEYKQKSNFKYERFNNKEHTIKNIILLLYGLNKSLKNELNKIPDDNIFKELKTKISKELLYYELTNTLDNKKKEKIVKI